MVTTAIRWEFKEKSLICKRKTTMSKTTHSVKQGGIVLLALILVLLLLPVGAWASSYRTVTPEQLKAMLAHKDFFLLDVHVPEQKHIPGTDAFIDYRTIKQHTDLLPRDKNTKIVVYCLGDTMSRSAAEDLIDLGYTQVYDLVGGTWAFRQLSD
jgi:rhodanese-related sulfurtransferase